MVKSVATGMSSGFAGVLDYFSKRKISSSDIAHQLPAKKEPHFQWHATELLVRCERMVGN